MTTTAHASDGLNVVQGDAMRPLAYSQGSINRILSIDKSNPNTTQDNIKHFENRNHGPLYFGFNKEAQDYVIQTIPHPGGEVWGGVSIDWTKVTPSANENRPVNVAVRYLIRARD